MGLIPVITEQSLCVYVGSAFELNRSGAMSGLERGMFQSDFLNMKMLTWMM